MNNNIINFILVDDEQIILDNFSQFIKDIMIQEPLRYKINTFREVNNQLLDLVNDDSLQKIYLLDIQIGSDSGIDLARTIREHDYKNIIIFLTSQQGFENVIVSDILMCLTYINKFNNPKPKMERALKKAIHTIGNNKILSFNTNNISYKIPIEDILYINKEKNEKYVTLHTNYLICNIFQSLKSVYDQLTDDFIYCNRNILVNKSKIRSHNKNDNEILLTNGESIPVTSRLNLKSRSL